MQLLTVTNSMDAVRRDMDVATNGNHNS